MNNKTVIKVRNPDALNGILDLALAGAKKNPQLASKYIKYAQDMAESIGAIEIIERRTA